MKKLFKVSFILIGFFGLVVLINFSVETEAQVEYPAIRNMYPEAAPDGEVDTPNLAYDYQPLELNEVDLFNNVVIFVKFSDEVDYVAPYTIDEYEFNFNGIGGPSMRDYYLEVSYGQLTVQSYLTNQDDDILYYVDTHPRAYFQPYNASTNTLGYEDDDEKAVRIHTLLAKAVIFVDNNNLVPDDVDLDVNDNGYIDALTFLTSGEATGWNELLWPHQWALYNYETEMPYINGVKAFQYNFQLLGNDRDYYYRPNVGVLSHEMFHQIGATDLYHYVGYDYVAPVGPWDLMEHTGQIPVHMLGYMKEYYGGWIETPDLITENGRYSLAASRLSGDNYYKLDLGYSNESLYFEYRDHLGNYESNLPGAGLIVYRVDGDLRGKGNVDGYYDASGDPAEEVFVFRPGIMDSDYPIEFPEDAVGSYDGDIYNSMLSQYQDFDKLGGELDYNMFYSDGTQIDIVIYDIEIVGDEIFFSVDFKDDIVINSPYEVSTENEIKLINVPGTEYSVNIDYVNDTANTYYTTDGTMPTEASSLYTGADIPITETNNTVTVATYVDGELTSYTTETFEFVDKIETNHNPYDLKKSTTWVLSYATDTHFSLIFDSETNMEYGMDFLNITTPTEDLTFTGNDILSENLDFTTTDLAIEFVSDAWNNDYFGIEFFVNTNFDYDLVINGDATLDVEAGSTYIDQGATFTTSDPNLTLITTSNVDTNYFGRYYVGYSIVNELGETVYTVYRIVDVDDTIAPVISLKGDSVVDIEVKGEYIEAGLNIDDNTMTGFETVIVGEVKERTVGQYILEYYVIDAGGNISNTIQRIVNVLDLTAPEGEILPSLDTIRVGETWVDGGVDYDDNYEPLRNTYVEITNGIDNTVVGEYEVIYSITDASGNELILKRIVNVVDDNAVIITLNPGVTTINIGQEFVDTLYTATKGGESIVLDIDSNVDNTVRGTYTVTYSTTVDGVYYQIVKYVTVIDDRKIKMSSPIYKEENEFLI